MAVMGITQLHTFVKAHQTAHLKLMNFTVGKLYLHKADLKKKECMYFFSKHLLSIYYALQSLYQIFQLDYLCPTCNVLTQKLTLSQKAVLHEKWFCF